MRNLLFVHGHGQNWYFCVEFRGKILVFGKICGKICILAVVMVKILTV